MSRIEVRQLASEDGGLIEAACRLLSSTDIAIRFPRFRLPDAGMLRSWIRGFLASAKADLLPYGVWVGTDRGGAVQSVVVVGFGEETGCSLAYATSPGVQGRGIGPEAVGKVLLKIASRYPAAVISAAVPKDNPASIRVVQKLGFTRKGLRLIAGVQNGEPVPHFEINLEGDRDSLREAVRRAERLPSREVHSPDIARLPSPPTARPAGTATSGSPS